MNKNESNSKLVVAITFIIWGAIVLSAFYITQRPLVFQVIGGLASTFWAITLMIILLFDSAGIGYLILQRIYPQMLSYERLILGSGFGLGILGLTGYGLGVSGLASVPILATVLLGIAIFIFFLKIHITIWSDFKLLINSFRENREDVPFWLPLAVLITILISFFFSLLPPAEGFDALSYHLRIPELLLKDGQILRYNIPAFWYPNLIEGDFLWALGLGSERTAQLIHWSFSMLILTLIWRWSYQIFGSKSAWWALAVLISMPSLPWISSWAYTDMALTFYGFVSLYTIWRWKDTQESQWLLISGAFAGMAMGIKYTSFILPTLCVLLILFYEGSIWARFRSSIIFSIPATLIASPWYLRNWLLMDNPFYPFVFGGLYWDTFRANWFSGVGTGIGWDFKEIFLLPFTLTLGYRDHSYYDGRLGPLFLLLLPFTICFFLTKKFVFSHPRQYYALLIVNSFAMLNYFFWVFSVINTANLWQTRLLLPGLVPFTMSMGLGIANLEYLNLPQLRVNFIITTLIGLVIAITLLNNSLSLIVRRPLEYSLGVESRQEYFKRMQLDYAQALEVVNSAPKNAYIYFIFEPRSYTMTRKVQPDLINDNLMHDYYIYKTSDSIITNWKLNGYSHILVSARGMEFYVETQTKLKDILEKLKVENSLGNYTLYSIP